MSIEFETDTHLARTDVPPESSTDIRTPIALPPAPLADRLRARIEETVRLQQNWTKDEIRSRHDESRLARLRESQKWIRDAWRKRAHRFANGSDISPQDIRPTFIEVKTTEHHDLFRLGRFTWSLPYSRGYGRRLRFLVIDEFNGALMGILGLQSAPIDFTPRDRNISYPEGRKVELVNQTMDIFTLGAIPPYNNLLAGKLIVYAAASQEVYQAYKSRYDGQETQMEHNVIPSHLVMLTTTSAFGRSSIYNRVTYSKSSNRDSRTVAMPLGYTKGFGNFHLDSLYPDLKHFLFQQGSLVSPGFGSGPKPVWQNITRTLRMLNVNRSGLKHGIQREAWYIPLAKNAWEYLNGEVDTPNYYDTSFSELADWWKNRWLLPRSERVTDWQDWRKESLLQSITIENNLHDD